jgi:thiopeptide-type bacteriocin biosynthesis protein
MPTHHVTLSPQRTATTVEAVLAGTDLETAAAEAGITAGELAEAIDTYRSGGLGALTHAQDRAWYQARIELSDWASAEATFATHIAPRLDGLDDGQASWWFLRKHPCWRLRLRTADRTAAEALLDDLVLQCTITSWHASIYEPETAAFGGSAAMDIVHDLFCADSRGVIAYAHQDPPRIGRRELSLLLIRTLQEYANLDCFEAADVFDQVCRTRPTPAHADQARVDRLTAQVRPLLSLPATGDNPLFTPTGPAHGSAPWLEAFAHTGRQLGEAATRGKLERGLRAILAHIVIFHWNRLGLSATSQGVLAHAAKAAILRRS